MDEMHRTEEEQDEVAEQLERVAHEEDAHLVTLDANSGQPRETALYFAVAGRSIYLLAGGGEETAWVRDIHTQPAVTLRIGEQMFRGTARVLRGDTDTTRDAIVRRLLATKYEQWQEGKPLSSWARIALPVAITVAAAAPLVP